MIKFVKILSVIALVLIMISCGKDNDANFTLKGSIKDLKKGVVYLQKDGDSAIIDLDSMAITGQPEFTLQTKLMAVLAEALLMPVRNTLVLISNTVPCQRA